MSVRTSIVPSESWNLPYIREPTMNMAYRTSQTPIVPGEWEEGRSFLLHVWRPPSLLGRNVSLRRVVAKTTAWVLSYGKSLEKKNQFELRRKNVRMPPPCPPLGVPRERCPFSGRVGGVSIRILKSKEPLAHSESPSLPYPELEHVTASDFLPAYVYPLARRFLKHNSVAKCTVLPIRSDRHGLPPSVTVGKFPPLENRGSAARLFLWGKTRR